MKTIRNAQLDLFGGDKTKVESDGIWFFVKKHNAVHKTGLHYDLRIQSTTVKGNNAIMKSFSVKTNASDRTIFLADLVDDHELKNSRREGTILEEKGEGALIHWDEGFCEVDGEDYKTGMLKALNAGIDRGQFELIFSGRRMKGKFSFQRTGSKPKDKWTIKRIDDDGWGFEKYTTSALTTHTIDFYMALFEKQKEEMGHMDAAEKLKYIGDNKSESFKHKWFWGSELTPY